MNPVRSNEYIFYYYSTFMEIKYKLNKIAVLDTVACGNLLLTG